MPQIRSDFDMYYNGSCIGVRSRSNPDVINPFFIQRIEFDDNCSFTNISDPRCEQGLIFVGDEVTDPSGNTSRRRVIGLDNEDLVLENPELGYVKLPRANKFTWISYRADRTVKKGITDRRMGSPIRLTMENLYALFHAKDNGRISKDYIKVSLAEQDYLEYKGLIVGQYTTATTLEVEPEMSYQLARIREENPSCQVTIKE